MTKLEAIATSKTFRKEADELLQRMKGHKGMLLMTLEQRRRFPEDYIKNGEPMDDLEEVIAQHIISTRDLESCIMRQGMALKYIGAPNPYPESKNPDSPVVEPTADGLKM